MLDFTTSELCNNRKCKTEKNDQPNTSCIIDIQTSPSVILGCKYHQQTSESNHLGHNSEVISRCRSSSFTNCVSKASGVAAGSVSRADLTKTLPAKLNLDGFNRSIVMGWKKERLLNEFSRIAKKSSQKVTPKPSPCLGTIPDASRCREILGKVSLLRIGDAVLTTVRRLFNQILSKPLLRRQQTCPQETTGETISVRKKALRQQCVKNRDETEDNFFTQRGSRKCVVLKSGEKHNTEEKMSSSEMNTIEMKEGEAPEDDEDNVTREEFPQTNNKVRSIVEMFEARMRCNEDMRKQNNTKPHGLRDEAIKDMRLLMTEWQDRKHELDHKLKINEIPERGCDQDTPRLVQQSPMDEVKENTRTHIERSNKPANLRLIMPGESSGARHIGMVKEEEEEGDDEYESETSEESEDESPAVVMRSRPRGQAVSFYRYSTLRQSQPSMIRPRTVIIGIGVCTETKFINDSFGDGVSETESEDEEDISPAPVPAPAPTPTRQRPTTPSRTSRPHSPLSDMDTESKRNSQAVSTEPSDLEDHSSVTTSDLDCHEPQVVDSRKDKAYRIALELLHTERTYVKVLHLIDQEFQFRVDNENRAHHMFPHDVILHMFSNIKSIYKLHHDFLLPQLEERMAQWEQNRRIGDIMKNFAPFLKMYTEYVRNFDNAMTLINQWQAKCPRFATIMDDIHSMEVCGNLTLQHHMLSPVQRIPRYEMLLRDYLKKLPEDSPDCHDTEKALHLVSTAANHANDAMKKIDKFEKLLEIQESLGGAEDLVSPTRELIKEGKIIKISARSGDHQERYIFLLTDLLLLCSPRLMSGRVMSGPQYRLRAKYHVENLIIQEGDNLETANTFYIKDNNKSVELYTQTIEEKDQWLDAFIRAIHETSQRKSSLKLHFDPNQRVMNVDLGQKQPMLMPSDSVTKCMECDSQFTMVRRKHHCRACGFVVCSKCSSFKASLAYECGKSVRVCRTCHATLQELSSSTATPSPEIDDGDECSLYSAKEPLDLPFRNRGVLEVSAKTGGAVIQGFLQLKTHRKTWVKRWFTLHTDFVLYSFKCEADDQALTATPVPGFTVTHLQGTRNESGISDKEKERAFKLHHTKKQYIFQAASKDESQRWVAALKKASQAELPSPVQ